MNERDSEGVLKMTINNRAKQQDQACDQTKRLLGTNLLYPPTEVLTSGAGS
jgi:hypothetical protein